MRRMQSDKAHKAVMAAAILFCLSPLLRAEQSDLSQSFLDKARKAKASGAAASDGEAPLPASNQEDSYENTVSSSTLSLIRPPKDEQSEQINLQEGSEGEASGEEIINTDKPDASASIKTPQFKKVEKSSSQKAKEPGRGIKWIDSSTRNFNLKVEPQTSGIMTPNLGMKFETVHQVLSKNISWMMSGKSKVYVYQNRQSFLRNEPVASSWSGAFFSPTEDRIVMYDEPKNTSKMLSQFTHELTHLLFAVLTFHKPVDLDIGTRSNGGYVAFKGKGTWLITITPYFFPLFAVILMFLFPFFKGTRSMAASFDAVFGFFVCYHFLSVFQELHPQQTDLHKAGPVFCLCFLPGANLITAGLLLGFANMQGKGMTTFINLLYRRAISSYDALLRLTETFF